MKTFIYDGMPDWSKFMIQWLDGQPIVSALLLIMVIDVAAGLCRAAARKTLSSTISWRGMSRKVIMLQLVGVAAVLEPFAGGLPLSKLVGVFYIVTEALSVIENAAAAGVPLPRPLVETLAKLRDAGDEKHLPVDGTRKQIVEERAEEKPRQDTAPAYDRKKNP